MRRTKIVCTLGPSSADAGVVRELIRAGMDVARLNFSHGTHEVHRATCGLLRAVAAEQGRNLAVLMDLQGPKIRTGPLQDGRPVVLSEGAAFCITTRPAPGSAECVSTTYEHLPSDVKAGDRVMIADGSIELRVQAVSETDVHCRVLRGGALGEHKGINLPGVPVSAPSLTKKDIADLDFGLGLGVDYVALSFVRKPDDIREAKARIAQAGKNVPIVAKIERPEALDHFDAILELADGIMIARGDLGVEVTLDDVPQIQKDLIRRCNARGKPVITATQMLESMMSSARPTRAEVTDVANAVYDGTDAVMLSGETAAGRFPVESAQMMASIVAKADAAIASSPPRDLHESPGAEADSHSFSRAIGHAARRISETLPVNRIVCFTMSGYTAAMIARYRPRVPITAITLSEETRRRCALIWGVEAETSAEIRKTDEMVPLVDRVLLERHLSGPGDTIIVVAGAPVAIGGRTNLLRLHTVGDVG